MIKKICATVLMLCFIGHVAVSNASSREDFGKDGYAHQHEACGGCASQSEPVEDSGCSCLLACAHCCHILLNSVVIVEDSLVLDVNYNVPDFFGNSQSPFLKGIFRPPEISF